MVDNVTVSTSTFFLSGGSALSASTFSLRKPSRSKAAIGCSCGRALWRHWRGLGPHMALGTAPLSTPHTPADCLYRVFITNPRHIVSLPLASSFSSPALICLVRQSMSRCFNYGMLVNPISPHTALHHYPSPRLLRADLGPCTGNLVRGPQIVIPRLGWTGVSVELASSRTPTVTLTQIRACKSKTFLVMNARLLCFSISLLKSFGRYCYLCSSFSTVDVSIASSVFTTISY